MDVFAIGPFNLLERRMVSVKVDKRITKLCRQLCKNCLCEQNINGISGEQKWQWNTNGSMKCMLSGFI